MKHQFKKTAIAMGVAQIAMLGTSMAIAQEAAPAAGATVVVVTGQRAALNNAQKIKQNADEVVDSIVADDIGKLPDRSVTEVLQRIVGVTIDRTMSAGDPEHFSVEGSGVSIRGLTYVRSELNGRDSFSANGGRSLNFGDVPPELMAGVDVYKNPSAEQIEGSVGGLVNLRTALPFDFKGFKASLTGEMTHSRLKRGENSPSYSGLVSNRWKTGYGEFGALLDLAKGKSITRTDALQVEPYFPRTDLVEGQTVWVPKGAQWRTLEFDRERQGIYGALQWKLNNTLRSSLTYFKSEYDMQWSEQAIFAAGNPYNVRLSPDATFDANGALLTGMLTSPADGGINFNDDTRTAGGKSITTDLSWNVEWRPAPNWTVTTDLQKVKATSANSDSIVATGLLIPKQRIDLSGSLPSLQFDDVDRAYLANANNYYWAFTQEHLDRSRAEEKAGRIDVKYDFDHPVLRDVRVGVRLTDRSSVNQNSNPDYNWAAITQTWQAGGLAYLGDPRFGGDTTTNSFPNFFGGEVSVPSVVFPGVGLTTGYPDSYAKLHQYQQVLCAEQGIADCSVWAPATFGGDPAGINSQQEKTKAFYTQLRFGFDNLARPIDGNIGIRYVRTDMTAAGYTNYQPTAFEPKPGYAVSGPAIPNVPNYAQAQDFNTSYSNVLPSLNLRMKYNDQLQFRLALSKGLSRPSFTQLQGYTGLSRNISSTTNDATQQVIINSVSLTGEAKGNPFLKPITSKQIDLTAEYYFSSVGSVTVAVFNKDLNDIIVNQLSNFSLPDVNGQMQTFNVTSPVNGASGNAKGVELAYQQYFDKLPGWMSGFGVQGNFTFVDSKTKLYNPVTAAYCSNVTGAANLNLNLNGCDTDGRTFGNLPLQGLSRRAYNLALMYDKDKLSLRLAYAWRSKHLQGVNVNGTRGTDGTDFNPASPLVDNDGNAATPDGRARNIAWGLPLWADDYGQLDASIGYKINDNLSLALEATNLGDAKFKQLMEHHIGTKGRAWFSTGPRYTAQVRYNF